MKRYVFIYYYGQNQDILVDILTADEIRELIKRFKLNDYDYCIVEGNILKNFNDIVFDLENLK